MKHNVNGGKCYSAGSIFSFCLICCILGGQLHNAKPVWMKSTLPMSLFRAECMAAPLQYRTGGLSSGAGVFLELARGTRHWQGHLPRILFLTMRRKAT